MRPEQYIEKFTGQAPAIWCALSAPVLMSYATVLQPYMPYMHVAQSKNLVERCCVSRVYIVHSRESKVRHKFPDIQFRISLWAKKAIDATERLPLAPTILHTVREEGQKCKIMGPVVCYLNYATAHIGNGHNTPRKRYAISQSNTSKKKIKKIM